MCWAFFMYVLSDLLFQTVLSGYQLLLEFTNDDDTIRFVTFTNDDVTSDNDTKKVKTISLWIKNIYILHQNKYNRWSMTSISVHFLQFNLPTKNLWDLLISVFTVRLQFGNHLSSSLLWGFYTINQLPYILSVVQPLVLIFTCLCYKPEAPWSLRPLPLGLFNLIFHFIFS